MPMLHQEPDAMLFRLNRERLRNLKRFNATYVQLIAARRTGVLSKLSGNNQRRFLRQARGDRKLIVSNRFLAHDRLQVAGAIANGQKVKLSAVSPASQPSPDGHLLANMLFGGINCHYRHPCSPPACYARRRMAA
jgi:hypothetical protein